MLVSQILRSKGDTVFTVGPSETVAAVTALLASPANAVALALTPCAVNVGERASHSASPPKKITSNTPAARNRCHPKLLATRVPDRAEEAGRGVLAVSSVAEPGFAEPGIETAAPSVRVTPSGSDA